MKRKFLDKAIVLSISSFCIFQSFSIAQVQAQSTSSSCTQVQESFVAAMSLFRTAFFEREDAVGTAEFVLSSEVDPVVEKMEEVCPAKIVDDVNAGLEKSIAALASPNRAQIVECDKAIVSYRKLLNRFDNTNLPSYEAYRGLLKRDINSSAQSAVEVCPENMGLAVQTQKEIVERQKRLDKMQEMEEISRPTMADNIESDREAYFESLSDDE